MVERVERVERRQQNRFSAGLVTCVTCSQSRQVTSFQPGSTMGTCVCDLVTCVTHINRSSREKTRAGENKKPGTLAGLVMGLLLAWIRQPG